MQLTRLNIQLKTYGPHQGQYIAEITTGDAKSSITMELSPTISSRVLALAMDELCAATDEAAKEMKQRLLDAVPAALEG